MNPEQKAKELVESMFDCLYADGMYDAKRCAIVCVDEIIKAQQKVFEIMPDVDYNDEFWQDVKREIKKL